MKSKQILFISHDASRTGAPILLLNFLKWFKENSDIPFQILLKKGGVLQAEFAALAPTSVFYEETSNKKSLVKRIFNRLGFSSKVRNFYLKRLKAKFIQDNISLIYANTITNGEILEFLSSIECPVICHVHELEYWIRYRTGLKSFKKIKRYTQHYIAVSEAVKKNLIENHSITAKKIDITYEFIPTDSRSIKSYQRAQDLIWQELGIPKKAKIVCASGTTDWRKGVDLFIQLARTVSKKYSNNPVYFIWVGGEKQGTRLSELSYDVKKLGLEQYVRFLGVRSNPLDYFVTCDVFALVSREDPFPLVCLEAASLGKPIVCFDSAGGEKEFVEDDCGFVVPYLDIETMATKIINLLNSPELCQSLGQRAKQKVQERHALEVTAPKILMTIEKFLF